MEVDAQLNDAIAGFTAVNDSAEVKAEDGDTVVVNAGEVGA